MLKLKEAANCQSIEEIRHQIDQLDAELVKMFAKRNEFVREITKFKGNNALEIIAAERKRQVIEQRSDWAGNLGLDKELYAQIFTMLLEHNINFEFDIFKNGKK